MMKSIKLLLPLSVVIVLGCNKSDNTKQEAKNKSTEKVFNDNQSTSSDIKSKSLELKWETEPKLTTSESILFDEENDIIYVSNIDGKPTDKDGNGFISKVKLNGEIEELKWITGLDAPKGMGMYDDILYVTNITEVVEISISKGEITNRYPIEGAKFMNDITIDQYGRPYISDSFAHKIYRIEEGKISVWLDKGLNKPNGLYIEDFRMLLASWGDGSLKVIDLATKNISEKIKDIGDGDGIVPIGNGDYILSSWSGRIFYIGKDWTKKEMLNTVNKKIQSADIEYIPSRNLLLVPSFFHNTVMAYTLK